MVEKPVAKKANPGKAASVMRLGLAAQILDAQRGPQPSPVAADVDAKGEAKSEERETERAARNVLMEELADLCGMAELCVV